MSTKEPRKSKFKFKVALEAITGKQTLADICKRHKITAGQIYKWKKQLLENGDAVFEETKKTKKSKEVNPEKLYEVIGKLNVELEFLKKKLAD